MDSAEFNQDSTPADCFRLEELEAFQGFEGQVLAEVNYYLWLNRTSEAHAPLRFLYTIELGFEGYPSLLLSSGEDTDAIRVLAAEDLIKTARALQTLHGQVVIQRVSAGALALWLDVLGRPLEGVRLTKNAHGLYWNDALLLDFGYRRILVQLSAADGLEVGVYTD